jgi:hypothetical protein
MTTFTAAQARAARLQSLLLADRTVAAAHDVVTWFGAMQAQDLASGLWSLGVRLPGSTEVEMLAALEDGAILRTWPMRGTIHLVPAEDAHWMIDLMGSKMLATGHRRRENLGLTLADVERATRALADALAGGRRLTRAQALATINEAGVSTEGQRGYHVLWYAAQSGVTCIGPQVDGEQTFVLLDEWAPRPRRLSAREGAAELAFRYFRSHGPASVQDFAGWTGLGLGISRTAIADNHGRLSSVTVDGVENWVSVELTDDPAARPAKTPVALPGFDEFLLGYKDRNLVIPPGRFDAVVPGGNGIFRATVVADGVVVGTWTRTLTASKVKITLQPFDPLSATRGNAVERALGTYAAYLGRTPVLTVTDPL